MKLKAPFLLVPLILCLANVVGAQGFINGSSVAVQEDPSLSGSYTDSSLTLDVSNYTEPFISATGTFATNVPAGTEVYAYATPITGLSATPESEPISNFLVIGGPGPAIFGSSGTTPVNRFDFDLQTLEESTPGSFVGFGTLVDTTGTYGESQAEFQLSFSGANNYSFNLETVPEPATLSLLAVLGLLPFLRRKS